MMSRIMRHSAVVLALVAGTAARAAIIDGVSPGVTTLAQAQAVVSRLSSAIAHIPLSGPVARGEQSAGLTSIAAPIGEAWASLWVAASQNGVVQYVRLHVAPKYRNQALSFMNNRFGARQLSEAPSDETGVTDLYYYDAQHVAWVRGIDSEGGLEIIFGTYGIITSILSEDLSNPEMAQALRQARLQASSAAGTPKRLP